MKNTQLKVEDVFRDKILKYSISKNRKLNLLFSSGNNVKLHKSQFQLFKHRKKKNIDIDPSAPPEKKFC